MEPILEMVQLRATHEGKRGDVEKKRQHIKKNTSSISSSGDTGMSIEKPEYNSTITILSQAIYVSLIVDVVYVHIRYPTTTTAKMTTILCICIFSLQLIHIWPNKFYESLWVVNCVYAIKTMSERKVRDCFFLLVCWI